MKQKIDAEKALRVLAIREGKPVEEIRKSIQVAMLAGLCSPDPAVQARWKAIPCKGDVPTPEEVIEFIALSVKNGADPFGGK